MIEVKPIPDEEPGWCDIEGCTDEATVIATVPLPGGKTVHPRLCRLDWAEVVAAELLDMRKLRAPEPAIDVDEAIRNGEDEGD